MRKLITVFIALFVLAIPLIEVIAERSINEALEMPVVGVRKTVTEWSGGSTNAVKYAESVNTLPPLSAEECIEILNEDYRKMWESSLEESEPLPKTDAPTLRYVLTDEERAAIEQMVASEGGYCEYRFQALVATCILNGCEADGLRPPELFKRGDFWLTHDVKPTETTKQAVSDVFDRGILPTNEKIRYYYNPSYCTSAAHESKCYVLTDTDCRFFKDWE